MHSCSSPFGDLQQDRQICVYTEVLNQDPLQSGYQRDLGIILSVYCIGHQAPVLSTSLTSPVSLVGGSFVG